MFKFVFNYQSFFCPFIIACIIISCTGFTCVHDEQTDFTVRSTYARSVKFQDIRAQRAKITSVFEPLQVYFYLDKLDLSLSSNTIYNIEIALKRIRKYVSETFQVRERRRPFLLTREGCTQTWQFGINRGKCSKFKAEIEVCSAKEINYQVPQRFLDKLELYDFDKPEPRYSISSGTGLLDSNFLTFVTSQATKSCEGTDVLAYGVYCRLDLRTSEPLAGILNLCPNYFARKVYTAQHYYNVLLHELFHILGFSFHLFEKYLPCEKGIYCEIPKNIIVEDSSKIGRLVFPLVVKNVQNHFSCFNKSDFGGPLSLLTQDNITGSMYSSHWHPVLMYSSIMTPKFDEHDAIFVDNITLAVFASTGWYRVDFSKADNFRFGKGQGCDFGLDENCNKSTYLCNPSANATIGCDLMHKGIGKCTQIVSYHPCGVFYSRTDEICESEGGQLYELDQYAFSYKQKCFLVESESVIKPMCLPIKCHLNNTYDVFVDMAWYLCQKEEWINAGNTTLYCPFHIGLCVESRIQYVKSYCTEDDHFFIAVKMNFDLPTFTDLSTYNNFKNFKVSSLRGIASKLNISVNYIMNATLFLFKSISLDFAVCPPGSTHADILKKIVKKTQEFLDGGKFMHILKTPENMLVSSSNIQIDPTNAIAFSDHEGFRTLLIFPVIFVVFLIATITASIARLFFFRRRRPRRTFDNTELDNELSDIKTPS